MCNHVRGVDCLKHGVPQATIGGLLIVVMFCIPWAGGCSSAPAAAEPPTPKATVQHPETRELTDFDEYNGWTEASAIVEVRSRVRGHIAQVHFKDGDFVEQDAPLFELDPRPFQSEIDRATEQVKIATAQQYAAERDEIRLKELLAKKVVVQSEVDKAEAVRKTWDAQVASGEEEIKRRELELTYSKITAPISGKISRAMLTVGNLVNAGGSDPLMTTIVALDPIYVYFSVDERALLRYRERNPRAKADQLKPLEESQIPFEFGLETDEGFPRKGILDFADNRIDPATGTIQVRGKADNADGVFIPGGRVRVRIGVSDPYQALLIPDTAILTDQDKKYVLCLNEQNVVVRRNIRPGKLLPDGMRVVLPTGENEPPLTAEDWVIVLGLQRARINYAIEPMDAEGKPLAVK
jgi:RND family efflux transporter MFP subunit